VTQQDGTETPFENEYWDNDEPGLYVDIVSGEPLFASFDKFDSSTGWPSFAKPIDAENILERRDTSYGTVRTEVRSTPWRQPSGTRLSGWTARGRRTALLHQLGLAAVHPPR
jgi:methionine-R-sulfoxide reductase